jgi:hypothetical protein
MMLEINFLKQKLEKCRFLFHHQTAKNSNKSLLLHRKNEDPFPGSVIRSAFSAVNREGSPEFPSG